uniref:Uncharacterized protein n=1 Tax=Hucho hucho TaxID=62062 RepID=A0A4W5L997_9TELE
MALVGARASYHRILNQIELKLPAKLRPFYNHPAGNDTIIIRLTLGCLTAVVWSERSDQPYSSARASSVH